MYKYAVVKHFKKELKPYTKKYKGILFDVKRALRNFNKNSAIYLGEETYKIRLSVSSLKRGKSKSFRVIIYLMEHEGLIAPIAIYHKAKHESISKKQINTHLNKVMKELENFDLF